MSKRCITDIHSITPTTPSCAVIDNHQRSMSETVFFFFTKRTHNGSNRAQRWWLEVY